MPVLTWGTTVCCFCLGTGEKLSKKTVWPIQVSIYIYLQLSHTVTVGRGRGKGRENWQDICYSLPVTSQPTAVTAHKHNWLSSHSFQRKTMHHITFICCMVFDVQDHCEFSVAYLSGSGVASNKINNTKGRNLTLKGAYLSQQLLSHKIFTLFTIHSENDSTIQCANVAQGLVSFPNNKIFGCNFFLTFLCRTCICHL